MKVLDLPTEVNPVLVSITRGDIVESVHRGAYAVYDFNGNLIDQQGHIDEIIYPRSSIKIFQALPLIISGAADHYCLESKHLCLACASHNGEDFHSRDVDEMLGKASLSYKDLNCGIQWPDHKNSAKKLILDDQKPTALHNNCSGKHAGFLLTAKYKGQDLATYHEQDHPAQQEVKNLIEDLIEFDLNQSQCGLDGCSVPTWAAPLGQWAKSFAKLSALENFPLDDTHAMALPASWGEAFKHLMRAIMENPEWLAGTNRACTIINRALKGRVVVKTGAEGCFSAILIKEGKGLFLKCDDGATRGSEAMVAGLLKKHMDLSDSEHQVLSQFTDRDIFNRNKIICGVTQTHIS